MPGAFADIVLLFSVVQSTRSSLNLFQGISRFLGRRRRYTPVVASEGLAVAYGEVYAP